MLTVQKYEQPPKIGVAERRGNEYVCSPEEGLLEKLGAWSFLLWKWHEIFLVKEMRFGRLRTGMPALSLAELCGWTQPKNKSKALCRVPHDAELLPRTWEGLWAHVLLFPTRSSNQMRNQPQGASEAENGSLHWKQFIPPNMQSFSSLWRCKWYRCPRGADKWKNRKS